MMDVFIVVLLALAVYSLVGTVAYFISKENETVAITFGLGIVGLAIIGCVKLIRAVGNLFKYHIGKCSVFIDRKTGKRFRCKVRDANAVHWAYDCDMVKRYAAQSDYPLVPELDKGSIKKVRKDYREFSKEEH